MPKKKKKAVVPRLRFPEFRDAGAWKVKRLGEIATISNGLTADQSSDSNGLKVTRIETISEGCIDISKVGYIDRIEGVERFRLRVGDILFSHINSQSHIGKTALVEEDFDLYHGMNLLRLQVDKTENDPRFTYYLLNTEFFRKSVRARSNQAVNQASINQTEVGNSQIAVPSANEQQKIADCLSSLDDLIRAEEAQLAALKEHKKGLMQQLFPTPGETTPRLRFPEFRDAGPWEVKRLGELCQIQTGKKDANEGCADGAYPFFTCAEKHIYSNSYSFDCEAILVAGNANVGQTKYYAGKFEAYQRTYVLSSFSNVLTKYLFLFLSGNLQNDMAQQVQTSAMSYIKLPMLKSYNVPIPASHQEQQKIADCLSSIDNLIRAKTERINVLKSHKKGLMQQLFPNDEL